MHIRLGLASALGIALASALVGCGEKKVEPASGGTAGASAATRTALTPIAATGKTWTVKMIGDEKGYRFEPKDLTISAGDAVEWTLVSGGPHDVTFWADSVPHSAEPQLEANMPDTTEPLTAPLTVEVGSKYTVSFGGLASGVYHYFCTPHLAVGMVGTITVK